MNTELLIPTLTFGGTLLLVVTGLLNFSVFVRQLRAARDQLETARRQLESARQQHGTPDPAKSRRIEFKVPTDNAMATFPSK